MRSLALLPFVLLLGTQAQAADTWRPSTDRTAWQVFARMVAPVPGHKDVTFETWAADADLYGSHPPKWPVMNAPKLLTRSLGAAASQPKRALPQVAPPSSCAKPQDAAAGNFPASACIGEEVRHNRPAFDYLADNKLTTTAGLVKAYAGGKTIALPSDSVIAKADWVSIGDMLKWLPAYKTPDDIRRAYYTNSASMAGQTTEYALVGVSIQSRQTSDWVWMTFEHRSNPGRCDIIGCHDAFGAAAANVPPAKTSNSDYGACTKTPALAALFASERVTNPVWSNYCLKGTQILYVTPAGQPTLLGNSVVERINHGMPIPQISCIACHSTASFDKTGAPNFAALQAHPTGKVDPKLLQGFVRDDFVWGFLAAK
jgi:hypothetical protein